MTFEEWYENHVKYMTTKDFKPWLQESWIAAKEESAKVCDEELKDDWDTPAKSAIANCAAAIRRLK